MNEFFALEYHGAPFVSLGSAHVGALAAIFALNVGLAAFCRNSPTRQGYCRVFLAISLWLAESAWHVWNIAVGAWDVRTMLPLNVCSVLIWLSGFMLLRRDVRIYEFAYFLGIGGAAQYLATPDLGPYGFPHFRFIQAFTSHGLLLTAPIYMTFVEGLRPTMSSLRRVILVTNAYVALIFLVNLALGSDYMMLNAKPATPSLLDLLPPWPYYVLFMELIGLATCGLLYMPFYLMDSRAARRKMQAG